MRHLEKTYISFIQILPVIKMSPLIILYNFINVLSNCDWNLATNGQEVYRNLQNNADLSYEYLTT